MCAQLRRTPFRFLAERSAFSLASFFAGFGWANDAITIPLARISDQFPGPKGLLVTTRVSLTSTDPEHSFTRLLDALEDDLRRHGEPPSAPVARDVPLLAAIVKAINDGRPGLYLHEPTATCLFDTLEGHLWGIAEYDPEEARRQRAPLEAIAARLRRDHPGTLAPWHVLLRIAEGGDMFVFEEFCYLYHQVTGGSA
ncbi:MAG TPA: hypothetical protein VFP84_09240 [Kofleriaceae bacterium]|nr:hypothetical protein [Kofleriaceae bacterium]